MQLYEIYALKYAGPFTSSGAFLMWMKDWEKTEERNYYFWMRSYDKLRAKVTSPELLFPGHDRLMAQDFPQVAEGVTRLV